MDAYKYHHLCVKRLVGCKRAQVRVDRQSRPNDVLQRIPLRFSSSRASPTSARRRNKRSSCRQQPMQAHISRKLCQVVCLPTRASLYGKCRGDTPASTALNFKEILPSWIAYGTTPPLETPTPYIPHRVYAFFRSQTTFQAITPVTVDKPPP